MLRKRGPGGLNWGCPKGMRFIPRAYNPSIVPAPSHLCAQCAYVLSVRADAVNQCDAAGLTSAGFVGTALALLDPGLHVLHWTWLKYTTAPMIKRLRTSKSTAARVDDMIATVWDLRLLRVGARIYASYSCVACDDRFRLSLVHLALNVSADGNPRFEAWAFRNERPQFTSGDPWMRGRNQVSWVHATRPRPRFAAQAPPPTVIVQSRLHLAATFGPIDQKVWWRNRRLLRRTLASDSDRELYTGRHVVHAQEGGRYSERQKYHVKLVHNDSARQQALHLGGVAQLSPTANLVHVRRAAGCEAYLGVGHLHRGAADEDQMWWGAAAAGFAPRPNRTFRWGHSYMHFWYALESNPPFRMLATSGEFCIGSAQDSADCESIQYVSALSPHVVTQGRSTTLGADPSDLVLAWGVNDCEAALAVLAVEHIWRLLEPLPDVVTSASGCLTPRESPLEDEW